MCLVNASLEDSDILFEVYDNYIDNFALDYYWGVYLIVTLAYRVGETVVVYYSVLDITADFLVTFSY